MRPARLSRRRPQGWAAVSVVFIALLAGIAAVGCGTTTQAVTTGPFTRADRIASDLHRGVSTKADVERLLGQPNGRGMTLLPTQDRARELWMYLNVQTGDAKQEGRTMGVATVRVDVRQQQIYIFFDGDRFDGYMWAIDAGQVKVEPK